MRLRRLLSRRVAALAAALAALLCPAAANAADSVFWSNSSGAIRYGSLVGTGSAQNLYTGETFTSGVAIDPAAGKIYWASASAIRVANLDGRGAPQDLYSGEAVPNGVAIDPAGGRIYWANYSSNAIRVGNLDGSSPARDLYTGESRPLGVAIDPATGKIYWGDSNEPNTIGAVRVGNMDGSGTAQDLFANEPSPRGLALDVAAGRIYWANGSGAIRVANLDGTAFPVNLFSGENFVISVAVDPLAGKIYWTNNSAVRVANLNGSGTPENRFGGESDPRFPALLLSPAPGGAPAVSGQGEAGLPLSCNQGSWAGDLLGGFLFRAPRNFAYAWLRDGAPIEGATESTYTPSGGGSYSCQVTASNQAGSSSQTSGPRVVAEPPPVPPPVPPARASFAGTRSSIQVNRNGRFSFSFRAGPGLTGVAAFDSIGRVVVSRRARVRLARKSFTVPASGRVRLNVKLSRKNFRILKLNRNIRTRVTVTLANSSGLTSSARKNIRLKASARR